MKLRAALVALWLCLVAVARSQETFEEAGATGRGPRLTEQKADGGCKQESNWQVCADDDWGPKCPSGCRIQGLSDKTDKEFNTRIDAIKKKLKDSETSYESIDIRTKETYKQLKDNLVAAQQTDGSYNQVSDNLRQKIDILKVKVSRQIERIQMLQKNIREQVVEMKRLEVDIDIKLRACKGSCAKGVDFNVDVTSYENIQKQLLQAESTDLRPNINPLPILKMKPMKDSTVDSRYKTLAQEKEKYPMFSDINQYSFVLEGKLGKEVSGCPSGCWVQGLITKAEREILSRVDSARLSGATSNSHSIKLLAEIKRLHEVTGGNGRAETETVKNVANLGNKLRKKLNDLKLKVKEQVRDLRRLHSAIEEQLAAMRRLEVDLDIKFRTCKGSCENVQVFMTSLEKYESWENDMKRMGKYPTDETKTLRDIRLVTQPQKTNATSFSELWPLLDMKELEMLESDDQCRLKLEDV